MTDDNRECEVPLIEQLRDIPKDYRTVRAIQWDEDGRETGHQFIPVGFMMHRAAAELESQAAEIERLKELLNTPEIEDFSKAVRLEAAHQVERWGSIDDRAKRPADWFWLVGYLAGKALHSQLGENRDKALHHCISTAAALCNWHAAIKGTDNRMRPGSSDVEKIVEQSFPGTVASAKGKS